MLQAAGREVVSKTSAYNITKLSYRVEVRVNRVLPKKHCDVILSRRSKYDFRAFEIITKKIGV